MNQYKTFYQQRALESALEADSAELAGNQHEAEMWKAEAIRYEQAANDIKD